MSDSLCLDIMKEVLLFKSSIENHEQFLILFLLVCQRVHRVDGFSSWFKENIHTSKDFSEEIRSPTKSENNTTSKEANLKVMLTIAKEIAPSFIASAKNESSSEKAILVNVRLLVTRYLCDFVPLPLHEPNLGPELLSAFASVSNNGLKTMIVDFAYDYVSIGSKFGIISVPLDMILLDTKCLRLATSTQIASAIDQMIEIGTLCHGLNDASDRRTISFHFFFTRADATTPSDVVESAK